MPLDQGSQQGNDAHTEEETDGNSNGYDGKDSSLHYGPLLDALKYTNNLLGPLNTSLSTYLAFGKRTQISS